MSLSFLFLAREEEIKLMTKLKITVDRQRDQLRTIKKDLQQKQLDNEAVSSQEFIEVAVMRIHHLMLFTKIRGCDFYLIIK